MSTTRGVPSTSTNLKEALCEKIPTHYDLLRKFRQQHGSCIVSHVTVENMYQGLNGVDTMVRETSEIDPKHGVGLTIVNSFHNAVINLSNLLIVLLQKGKRNCNINTSTLDYNNPIINKSGHHEFRVAL